MLTRNELGVSGVEIISYIYLMDLSISQKIIQVCDDKIARKGENVGLSFYAFFANKNDNPELLMEVAEWWIKKHKLDHFEKAVKVKAIILRELL